MDEDLETHRARLLAAGRLTQADLDGFRATALDPSRPEPVPSTAMQFATGFVRAFMESGKYTHYRLIIDGHILEIPDSRLFKAIVDGGTYRVYFTPNGAKLHGLEPVALAEVPDAVAEAVQAAGQDPSDAAARTDERVVSIVNDRLLAALGLGLDFTISDLAANRVGRLTPREQGKLRSSAAWSFGCATFFGLIGAISAASLVFSSVVASVIIGTLAALLVVGLVVSGVRARRDADAGKVISTVTRLVLDSRSGDERQLVSPDGTSFSVPLRAFSVRGHQPSRLAALSYRVYFAPRETEVMSLEPVDVGALLGKPDEPIG